MRIKLIHIIAGAAVLTLAGATTAPAQTQAQIRAEENRFRAMDSNGDGAIQRSEWRGSARSFAVHDFNNDGHLSGIEIRQGARRQAAQAPDYNPNYYGYNDWSARGFQQLDVNRDGRVAASEWHFDRETFYRVDRNRDNYLTRAEFMDTTFDDDRGDRFDDLDVNGDTRVGRGEWHGGASAFAWLDRNSDGVLTRQEMGVDAAASDDQFSSLDVNRDRVLTRSEWQWSALSFNRLDRNNDGRVTRPEFEGAGPLGSGNSARITVAGHDRWTDTGIFVRTGDEITFDATGRIQYAHSSDTAVDWRGAAGRLSNVTPVPELPIGHLIVRIANGSPMPAVGTVRAPRDGRLYLGINDDVITDNSGSFQVNVTVRRP